MLDYDRTYRGIRVTPSRYLGGMDDISREDLAKVLREACHDASERDSFGLFCVSDALKARARDSREDPLNALRAGLDYHFLAYEEQRDGGGRPFGPMMAMGEIAYPMPLDEVPDDVLELWASAVDLSPLALVAARFADLLGEVGYGEEPYRWCQTAIDLYQAAVGEEFGTPVELMESGRRAFDLALRINDAERRQSVVQKLLRLIQQSIEDGETPGVALPLLELLANQPQDARPEELEGLVDDATRVYGTDPWHLESALDIKAKLARPEDRAYLHLAQVDAFVDLARRSTGLVRYAHLQRAIEMAGERGLHDRAEELRRDVEGISEEELGLKEIAVEVQIPRVEIDQLITTIVGDDDLPTALTRFGLYLPVAEPEEGLRFVDELMAEHPLQSLMTRMTIGPENALLRTVQNPDDYREAALIDHEARTVTFFGYLSTDILSAILERYGPISSEAWFESPMIESAVAERIRAAIGMYEQGDYDGCASVITPRIERIIRTTARSIGLSTTRSPGVGGKSGGVKTLGSLLRLMNGVIPERTRRYLIVLLTEVTGLNLRNRISHGLVDKVSPPEAALLIHAACHLSLLVPTSDGEEE